MPDDADFQAANALIQANQQPAAAPVNTPQPAATPSPAATPATKGTPLGVREAPPEARKGTFKIDPAFVDSVPAPNKPAETKPVETKPVEKPVEITAQPLPAATNEPIIKPNKQRDYTGYSEQQVSRLKQMSNEAFEEFETIYKERQDFEKKLKDASSNHYLQHPNAYILDPVYQRLNADHYLANSEAKLWEQALIRAEAGEEFQIPDVVDEKTGQWKMSQMIRPTHELKVKMSQILQQCTNVALQKQQQMAEMQGVYSNRVKDGDERINNIRKKYFSWVSEAKDLETKVKVQGVDKTIKDIRSEFLGVLPPHYQGHILAQGMADMWVAYLIAMSGRQEAKQEAAVAAIKEGEATRAEPTSKNGAASDRNKATHRGPATFTLKGMPS